MQYKDYYKILGVNRDAKPEEIKTAYRKLARKYHPDVSKEPNAEERFKEVAEAYEVLKDPQKRTSYDQLGANWQGGQEFKPPPGWQTNTQFEGGDFSDFFEAFFGGRSRSPFGQQRTRAPFRQRGEDIQARITIRLEDAYQGASTTVQLPTGQTLRIKIPLGITAGQHIRLSGQGEPGMNGGPKGDLLLEVEFQPHPFFQITGTDIHLTLPITPWEAALGATVQVPTLGGKVDLKIPAGSQSGQKLRLKGRGLPAKTPGDQYLTLQIMTPKASTPAAQALYQQMAEQLPFNPREKMGG